MSFLNTDVEPAAVSERPEIQHAGNGIHRVRQTFVVNLRNGLHARPCALLVKTVQLFVSDIQVEANGEKASGHSIMGLMALAASHGTEITFTVTGKDAPQAMTKIGHLFATAFENAYR